MTNDFAHAGAGRMVALSLLAFVMTGACNREPKATAASVAQIKVIELPNGTIAALPGSPEEQLAHFLASNEPAPRTFRFGHDQFAEWSDTPKPATRALVSTILLILRNYPDTHIRLIGHTDNQGTIEANQKLAEARVGSIRKLLVDGGVRPGHVETEGHGMAEPIGDNATPEGRMLNRRIDLVVTEK
jgi:outer membrane protein OmpA-like peptidoglycan-associated protein